MDILKSKKFQALLAGLVVVIVQQFIPGLDETKALEVVGLISAYILGQGFADWGKEKAKIEAMGHGLKSN